MKKKPFLLLVIATACISCVNLPASYQKITEDKTRLIDFIYEPPEAAPGDSVDLYAIFAGKEADIDDINWKISFNVIKDRSGNDTAIDIQPYVGKISKYYFSPKTSSFHLSFKIPEDCISSNGSIFKEDWSYLFGGIEDTIFTNYILSSEGKRSIVSMFDSLSRHPEKIETFIYQTEKENPYLLEYLPLFTQLLSVKIRISGELKGTNNTIISDYIVNYNNLFYKFPSLGITKNNNPYNVIDAIELYRIRADNVTSLHDPLSIRENSEAIIDLLKEDSVEILVDKGYGYYLHIITNTNRDCGYVFGLPLDTYPSEMKLEEYSTRWYYQMEEEEIKGLTENQLMAISTIDTFFAQLLPPTNGNVKNFTIWLKISDKIPGTINSSQGSYVWEMRGKFTYTQEYLGSIGSNF